MQQCYIRILSGMSAVVTVYRYGRTTYGYLMGTAHTIVGPYMAQAKSLTVQYGHMMAV
jgi:hypothetical protein